MKTTGTPAKTVTSSKLLSLGLVQTPDEAAVEAVVISNVAYADRRDFQSLENLYAPEVHLDYTSLFGGQPEVISPPALMTRWAGFLPGFDQTRHRISNIQVQVNDQQAKASAEVVADHWLNKLNWQVRGHYDLRLVEDERDWKISALTFTLKGEEGSRDILAKAAEVAAAHPNPYVLRQQTRKAVLDFLTGLEHKDMNQVNAVWDEDAIQDMPYAPEGFPKRVVGKAALIKHYSAWPQNSGRAIFTDEIVFYPTQDPEMVFVEFHGTVEVITTNRLYDQHHVCLVHVENGKITLFREYFNPNMFSYAFGLNEGGSF